MVIPDGSIRFDFREIKKADIPLPVVPLFTPEFVHECFVGNILLSLSTTNGRHPSAHARPHTAPSL